MEIESLGLGKWRWNVQNVKFYDCCIRKRPNVAQLELLTKGDTKMDWDVPFQKTVLSFVNFTYLGNIFSWEFFSVKEKSDLKWLIWNWAALRRATEALISQNRSSGRSETILRHWHRLRSFFSKLDHPTQIRSTVGRTKTTNGTFVHSFQREWIFLVNQTVYWFVSIVASPNSESLLITNLSKTEQFAFNLVCSQYSGCLKL